VRHAAGASAERLRGTAPRIPLASRLAARALSARAANCAPCVVAKGAGLCPLTQFPPPIEVLLVVGWGVRDSFRCRLRGQRGERSRLPDVGYCKRQLALTSHCGGPSQKSRTVLAKELEE
jgi:hypothetical protein